MSDKPLEHNDLKLVIQIKDGEPFEHPIFIDNFVQAFPDIDPDNLPLDRFAPFVRVQAPTPGTYEVCELSYQWVDGVVKDVWTLRPMSDEEREEKYEQMVNEAYGLRDWFVKHCQDMIVQVTDPEGNQVWREVLAEFITWKLESVDPVTPPLPRLPVRSIRGKWRKLNPL